jgi:hypothetical protein
MRRSATYELADIRTDGHLAELVATARTAGASWRSIARRLYADHGVDVTEQTLRNWFTEVEQS